MSCPYERTTTGKAKRRDASAKESEGIAKLTFEINGCAKEKAKSCARNLRKQQARDACFFCRG